MNVKEYVRMQKAKLQLFEDWWIEQRMIDPDSEAFPEDMDSGSWDNCFYLYGDYLSEEKTEDPADDAGDYFAVITNKRDDVDPDGDSLAYLRRD